MGRGLLRPLQFLTMEPIVLMLASYMAVMYGRPPYCFLDVLMSSDPVRNGSCACLYFYHRCHIPSTHEYIFFIFGQYVMRAHIFIAAFSSLWTREYHQSVGVSGLHYLAMGIGFTVSWGAT